jgi:hypothetical protein
MCPVHFNGDAGHDNRFPVRLFIPLVNSLLKMLNKGDCKGRNGRVEI